LQCLSVLPAAEFDVRAVVGHLHSPDVELGEAKVRWLGAEEVHTPPSRA
jgi:hypothetical protein